VERNSIHPVTFRILLLVALIALAPFAPTAVAALSADELVLIVNKNVPAGIKTAEYYAKARLVPDGRIIQLDLPAARTSISGNTSRTSSRPSVSSSASTGSRTR
jgi:hypothetical protein